MDVIKAQALPMGILEEIHAEAMNVILEDGDMIIMVTDGIIDSVDSGLDQDEWLTGTILKCNTRNPQELADFIMEEALGQTNGIANDDMSCNGEQDLEARHLDHIQAGFSPAYFFIKHFLP